MRTQNESALHPSDLLVPSAGVEAVVGYSATLHQMSDLGHDNCLRIIDEYETEVISLIFFDEGKNLSVTSAFVVNVDLFLIDEPSTPTSYSPYKTQNAAFYIEELRENICYSNKQFRTYFVCTGC
jgi:hypothetical protein